ncbi:208545f1-cdbb-490b-a257-2b6e381bd2e2 [Sclerotinia trifoliorum]|uniref:208545f1-cdbb-490b-a257-2b6e381bd2e2 n=1 Tax=Sclerotinia trifoliorum TaxID=28548 RepID=A0A8H2ZRH5_9HELO|nr:208545f1-cdbb-490b-a257-2b6e381bd2e2 [Sclerotinia trifoliorum]
MPTIVHGYFIKRIVKELEKQLESIASRGSRSAEFAKGITSNRSTTLKLKGYGRHDPDDQFEHLLAQYPGVVIDVSFSQKRKDLNRLAEAYILGFNGNICIMIGIDLEYRETKKVTLSMWRPQIIANENGEMELVAIQTITDEVIRYGNGTWNESPQAGLHLQLKDFAIPALVSNYESINESMKNPLFISAKFMCESLEIAGAKIAMIEAKRGIAQPKGLFVRKRVRSLTPEKELDEDRRKKIRKEVQKEKEGMIHNMSLALPLIQETPSTKIGVLEIKYPIAE